MLDQNRAGIDCNQTIETSEVVKRKRINTYSLRTILGRNEMIRSDLPIAVETLSDILHESQFDALHRIRADRGVGRRLRRVSFRCRERHEQRIAGTAEPVERLIGAGNVRGDRYGVATIRCCALEWNFDVRVETVVAIAQTY